MCRCIGTKVFCGTSRAAEFALFSRISIVLRNLVLTGDKSTNMPYFVRFQAAIDNLLLYVDMTALWNTQLPFGLWWDIALNLSQILPVYLYLSVALNTIYLAGFRSCRRLITVCRKFAAVCRGIWQTSPRNLEKFAAENCGPYRCSMCWYISSSL